MNDLIERLEKAKGPDRDLADEILFACGWQINHDQERIAEVRANGWKCEAENGEEYIDTFEEFMNCACWYRPGAKPFRDSWMPGHVRPDPTASLNAARDLLDGFYWVASEGRTRDDEPLGGAQVFRRDYLVKPIAEAEHEKVEIAVCIAALKARVALKPSEQ